ncbi:efflux RND transporter periplasmic adaptor subunit [Cellulomonas fimi]|uniref:Efflux transporter, RND family, MFP subunit n=1 Tax=Cellulomonas fimi (strain ATCC 484 / DSM 20113 / JCM 1341 / CCUG 24087 / LMG 16345 / NBRC 15513 / NCIMB 8980 / NCTC 7547 / NRS-133) TaxID=590998 RepID=F4H0M8_CELFA|nr:HlyD family efflux transporter periplasmic adaptor subunit [Cellulomonas fimi]AEE45001.1 efflux transporter, RND family, MFP subunit [Cellulomonas fimi ATCC 484]NNH09008.1 HlyD family efflux transporter periplasmic adaptor subunit [Cellulomonas fimi]VEH27935.1 Cation efflux system protein CzcB [Cellulomonas fimi]
MLRVWRRTRGWVRAVLGAVVVGALATGIWWFAVRDATAAAEEPATRTVAASLTTMEKTVDGTGTLTPAVQEDVSFAVSGTVTGVAVTQGQTVTAGQTLATVDTLRLDADLLAAQATLATAQARLDDAQDADDGTSTADAQVASAQAQVEVAQAEVDDAQAALADATLVAPVDGLLTAVNLEVGDAVTGGSSSSGGSGATAPQGDTTSGSTAAFTIVGTDAWEVEIGVSDADVALLEAGDQAELTVDGADGTVFGTVSAIGLLSTSDSGVASYPVTIAVTGDQDGLHDGVSADVSVIYERRTDVLTVPSMAVSTVDGATVVTKVAADGTQAETPVTTGETADGMTEITDGLAEGDEVVLAVLTPRATQGGTDQGGTVPGEGDVMQGFPGGGMAPPDGATFPGGGQVSRNG